jgi:hypothetical protein
MGHGAIKRETTKAEIGKWKRESGLEGVRSENVVESPKRAKMVREW